MPYNGAGVFTSLGVPEFPAVSGEFILASYFNANLNDIFLGLSTALTRDGQSAPTANLPMANFTFTALAAATLAGNPLVYAQQNASLKSLTITEGMTVTAPAVIALPTPASNVNTTQAVNAAWVNTYYAPIADPAFTGIPTAPTAAPGTNTNQIATMAALFVAGSSYAPINSPTFTGIPAAPTAAPGTNTTQLATTAFVQAFSVAAGNVPTGGTARQVLKKNSATNFDMAWGDVSVVRVSRSSNTILALVDSTTLFDLSGTFTQTLTAAATLGAGWNVLLRNVSNGTITLDPNGAELIDGLSTFSLLPGYTIKLICTGTGFTAVVVKARTYNNVLQYTASNTFVVPQDVYVIRGYAFGAGAAGSAGGGGAGGGCGYGDIAVIPGQSVTVSITSGIATVAVGATTMLLANPGSGIFGGSGGVHSSVTNGGSATGGAGAGGGQTGGASSGSPLGNGFAATASQAGSGWGGVGANGGGGGVGAAGSASGGGGDGLTVPSTDPLLTALTGRGGTSGYPSAGNGGAGGPGGGGGKGDGSGAFAGNGGFGGGGGYATTFGTGGAGGFGGGGGGAGNGTGGAGGFGGGGGSGGGGGVGGPAVIRIYY